MLRYSKLIVKSVAHLELRSGFDLVEKYCKQPELCSKPTTQTVEECMRELILVYPETRSAKLFGMSVARLGLLSGFVW
jgi:hypothetical protein